MAKALANGLPIGAMLVAESASRRRSNPGDHGTTFGGSPVPCAAALAHLRVRDAIDLEAYVAVREVQLMARLAPFQPRGIGLLIGVPLPESLPVGDVVTSLRERGVLAGSAGGNTLRLAPPLIVSEEEVDQPGDAIEATLAVRSGAHA